MNQGDEDKQSFIPFSPLPPANQGAEASSPWKAYLNKILIALSLIAILLAAMSCCINAIYAIARSTDWTKLHSFGRSMSLQSARYLNFALDMVVRGLTVAASLLLNYVAIRIVTALSFKRAGVLAKDAIALNLTCISFMSLWEAIRLRVPRTLRIYLAASLLSGLTSYFASSLIFGYQALEINKVDNREVQLWSYDVVLGSNTSAQYIAPNYTDLAPSDKPSIFAGPAAKTLASLDTEFPNMTSAKPYFTTVAESREDLLIRNITKVLQTETISTKLIDCHSIGPSNNASLSLHIIQGSVANIYLTITDGPQGQLLLGETMSTPMGLIFPSGPGVTPLNKAYTFIMQTVPDRDIPLSPSSLSRVAIALVDFGVCTSGQMRTPFGDIVPFNSTPLDIPLTVAGIVCSLQRTRSLYDEHTEQNTTNIYLSPPIIRTASSASLYSPISSPRGLNGVGALLYQQVNGGNEWRIPNCNSPNPSAPWSVDNTELWYRAVQLVEIYESSLLQSAEQLQQSSKQVRVSVSVIAYRLAILPAALLVFGLFLGVLCCLLMYLLVFWSWIPHGYHPLDPLRIVDEVDRNNSIGDRLPFNRPVELPPKELEKVLGAKRLRRHVPRFEEE
ncbi:hypothetical protein FRC08_000951 [Ceratobasidium sp. 394]|nr:hypothetical protein FRC08_000951 [Ceratobasidium sp. 394]